MNTPHCRHETCPWPSGPCAGFVNCPRDAQTVRPYQPLPTITIKLPLDQAVALYTAVTTDTRERVRMARHTLVKAIGESPV